MTTCTYWQDLDRMDGGKCTLHGRTVSFGICKRCPDIPPGCEPPTAPPLRGAGDAVAIVAQPIARMIDRVAVTNIAGCGGCKKRQELLNKAIPFRPKN